MTRVEAGDQPAPAADARQDIEQGEPVILGGGEARHRRAVEIAGPAGRIVEAHLVQLVVQEQALGVATGDRVPLPLGRPPGDGIIVREEDLAAPVGEGVGDLGAVGIGPAKPVRLRRIIVGKVG